MPSVIGIGALSSGAATALPTGLAVNDVLVLHIQSTPGGTVAGVTASAGGTWTYLGPFSGGESNAVEVRGTWMWSRYNGTQTAPTLGVPTSQLSRMVAVRDCITTGDPYIQAGSSGIFPETATTIPSVTTPDANCLVLDCIVGSGPDADGTGVYTGWTNAALSGATEIFNDSSSIGPGGSLAMLAATKATAGATGTTAVAHASFNVAYKKIALIPVPMISSGVLATTLDAIALEAAAGPESAGVASITLGATLLVATAWLPVSGGTPWRITLELEELP
jgi:hypothetical protein